MKKSISIWSFYGNWSLEEKLRLAKKAGFAGLEIDLSEDGPVALKSKKSEVEAVRSLADKVGIQLSGLATGLYWGANAASADAATRKKAAHILERQLECASWLGLDAILVVPGAVGVDFIPGCEVVPYDLAYERAQEFIKDALPLAEKLKVTIAIENVWNKFLLSPLEMRQFVDSFKNERVKAYLDVGNVVATGYGEHWVSILGKRIARVHVKDYRRAVGSAEGFVDLLSGNVNWPDVVQALKKAGYQGWVTAEMIPPVPFYRHCPEVLIHNTSQALDAILKLA
jgi:hexulose-6-phosphate isomerase